MEPSGSDRLRPFDGFVAAGCNGSQAQALADDVRLPGEPLAVFLVRVTVNARDGMVHHFVQQGVRHERPALVKCARVEPHNVDHGGVGRKPSTHGVDVKGEGWERPAEVLVIQF